jgi:hypothetical protein
MIDDVSIGVRSDPLALIFERDDGFVTTAPLKVEIALGLGMELIGAPEVLRVLKMPEFMKRLMIRIFIRSYQDARRERILGKSQHPS